MSSVGSSDDDARSGSGSGGGGGDGVTVVKQHIKRKVHNEVERRRKDKINTWIVRIGDLLPVKEPLPKKQSKIGILERAAEYIIHLRTTNEKLLLDSCSETQAQEFQRLRDQVTELERHNSSYLKLLKKAGISPVTSEEIWEHKAGKLSNKISPEQVEALLSQHENGTKEGGKKKETTKPPDKNGNNVETLASKVSTNAKPQKECPPLTKEETSVTTSAPSAPSQEGRVPQATNDQTSVTRALPAFPVMSISQNSCAKEITEPQQKSASSDVTEQTSNVQNKPLGEGVMIRPETKPSPPFNAGQVIIGTTTILPAPQQQWPSALLLPNGQIIPVVSQPSIVYTTPPPAVNSGLILTQSRGDEVGSGGSVICSTQLGVILKNPPTTVATTNSALTPTSSLPLVGNLDDAEKRTHEESEEVSAVQESSPKNKNQMVPKSKSQKNGKCREGESSSPICSSNGNSNSPAVTSSPQEDFHDQLESISNSSAASDGSSKEVASDNPSGPTDILAKATESIFSSSLSDLSPSMPGFNGSDNEASAEVSCCVSGEEVARDADRFAFRDMRPMMKERLCSEEQPSSKRLCTDKHNPTEKSGGNSYQNIYMENRQNVSDKNQKDTQSFSIADMNADNELPALILSSLGEENEAPSSVSSNSGGLPFLSLSPPDSHFHGNESSAQDQAFGMMGNNQGFCHQMQGYGVRIQPPNNGLVSSEACKQSNADGLMRSRLSASKNIAPVSLPGPAVSKRHHLAGTSEHNMNYTPPLSRPFLPHPSNSNANAPSVSSPFYQHAQIDPSLPQCTNQSFKQVSTKAVTSQMNTFTQRPHNLSSYSAEALIGHHTPVSVSQMSVNQNSARIQCSQQQQSSARNLLPYSTESLLQNQPYSEKKRDGSAYCQPFQRMPPGGQVHQHFSPSQSQTSPGIAQQNHFGNSPPLLMRHYSAPTGQPSASENCHRSPNPQMYSSFGLGVPAAQNNGFAPHSPSLNCLQNLSSGGANPHLGTPSGGQQQSGCLFPSSHNLPDPTFPPHLSLSSETSSGRSSMPNHFAQPQNHFFPAPSLGGPISPRNGFIDPSKKDHRNGSSRSPLPKASVAASPTKTSKSASRKAKQQAEELSYDRTRMPTSYFSVPELSSRNDGSVNHFFSQRPPLPQSQQQQQQSTLEMAPNASYNPLFRPQSQSGTSGSLNLNFQPPGFSVNHIHRLPNTPTSQASSGNLPSSGHHVPNFNLSNIFPDMGDTSSKFHPAANHHMLSTPVGQMQPSMEGTGALSHHQGRSAPPLYHSRGFNGIHGFDSRPTGNASPFGHPPAQSFGNVIPSLNFSVHDH